MALTIGCTGSGKEVFHGFSQLSFAPVLFLRSAGQTLNDLVLPEFNLHDIFLLNAVAAASINGIAGGVFGRTIYLVQVDGISVITLRNLGGASQVQNRLRLRGGVATLNFQIDTVKMFMYMPNRVSPLGQWQQI